MNLKWWTLLYMLWHCYLAGVVTAELSRLSFIWYLRPFLWDNWIFFTSVSIHRCSIQRCFSIVQPMTSYNMIAECMEYRNKARLEIMLSFSKGSKSHMDLDCNPWNQNTWCNVFMRMKFLSQNLPIKVNWKTLYYVSYRSNRVLVYAYAPSMTYVWYYIRQHVRNLTHWPINSSIKFCLDQHWDDRLSSSFFIFS